MSKKFIMRDVTPNECPWLSETIKGGTEVFEYTRYTYGCISPKGQAVSMKEDENPFFEIPIDALGGK
jgi:hypothetical protein